MSPDQEQQFWTDCGGDTCGGDRGSQCDACREADELDDLRLTVERMRPVVEAAIRFRRNAVGADGSGIVEAVDAYEGGHGV